MKVTIHSHPLEQRAFTLLEMMVVMLVLSLLLTAIVSLVRSTVQLADDITIAQRRESQTHGLARFCEKIFRSVHAESFMRLQLTQGASGRRYLSELMLSAAPSLWGGSSGLNEVMLMHTIESPDGYLQLQLVCMTTEQALHWMENKETLWLNKDEGVEAIMLADNISELSWKCYDPASKVWKTLWNHDLQIGRADLTGENKHPRPLLIELTVARSNDAPQRWTFWVPAAEVPELPDLVPEPVS